MEEKETFVEWLFKVLIVLFLSPLFVMWIWNWIVPGLCGFNEITYWHSFFACILGRLLCK